MWRYYRLVTSLLYAFLIRRAYCRTQTGYFSEMSIELGQMNVSRGFSSDLVSDQMIGERLVPFSPSHCLPMSLTSLCGWVLLLALPANSILTNITIDDTNTTYFSWVEPPISFPAPNPMWAAASASNPCSYCSAQPQSANASAINNQTWHDGRNGSSGSLTFQGIQSITLEDSRPSLTISFGAGL
jgi:hypothetical protein